MDSNNAPILPSQPLALRCLALTGAFETGSPPPACFGCVSGDFDGQGISYSALQWNLGQGTLQPLIAELHAAHPGVLQQVFPEMHADLSAMLSMPRDQQLAWARSIQTPKRSLLAPWAAAFETLGRTAEFQSIAARHASEIFQSAQTRCRNFALTSERALALLFDIGVQNGGIAASVQALILQDFAKLAPGDPDTVEIAKMQIVANRRSDAAAAAWREDVRTRKLVIANGIGDVHGIHYDLAAGFGISMAPWKPVDVGGLPLPG